MGTVIREVTYLGAATPTGSGGGGGGGGAGGAIEWTNHWDKPQDQYTASFMSLFPTYKVPELDDGHYRFYFAGSNIDTNGDNIVLLYQVFALDFHIWTHEGERRYNGGVNWVFDGETGFRPAPSLSDELFAYIGNSNGYDGITFSAATGNFRSYAGALLFPAFNRGEIKNAFLWTDMENVDTGEKIPVEIEVNTTYQQYYGTHLEATSGITSGTPVVIPEPHIPDMRGGSSFSYNDSAQYIAINTPSRAISDGEGYTAFVTELDVALYAVDDYDGTIGTYHVIVENGVCNYTARVLEATGILADVEIGYCETAEYTKSAYLKLNTTLGSTGTVQIQVGTKGAKSEDITLSIGDTPDFPFVPLAISTVGYPVLLKNFGAIDQYKGATDANYTNGYFYKASGTIVNVQESLTCTETSSTGTTITCNNIGLFIADLVYTTGMSEEEVKQALVDYPSWIYDVDNSTLSWVDVVDITDPAVINFIVNTDFTFSPTPSAGDVIAWDVTYTPADTYVQNGAWSQINVEPDLTSITGYDATKTQTLKNVTGTLTWVDDLI